MSNIGQFFAAGTSPWAFPAQPFPLNDEGLLWNDGNIIPHKGTLIDSVEIPIVSTGNFQGRLGTSVIWTVTPANINAAVDNWTGIYTIWYDSVQDRLYTFGLDTTTAPDTLYLAYITLETGAITNVGNVQFTTDPATPIGAGDCAISRSSIDSGNFTMTFNDRTIVINESTGAEVSNVASTNTTESNNIGSYSTLDGTMFIERFLNGDSNAQALVTRSKNTVFVPMPNSIFATSSVSSLVPLPWGDKVKMIDNGGAANKVLTRTYLRAEFDIWAQKMGNFGGLA